MRKNLVPAVCLLTALLAPSALATSLHVSDDADVAVDGRGQRGGGADRTLEIGGGEVTLLRFDLLSLPEGAFGDDIEFARLKLWVGSVRGGGTLSVRDVLGDWNERTLAPASLPPFGEPVSSTRVDRADVKRLLYVDVTCSFRRWLDGEANHGIAPAADGVSLRIDSKENRHTRHPPEIKLDPARHSARGSGLGLVIAREFVESMGGRLRASSTPGRGSTFDFVIACGVAAEEGRRPRFESGTEGDRPPLAPITRVLATTAVPATEPRRERLLTALAGTRIPFQRTGSTSSCRTCSLLTSTKEWRGGRETGHKGPAPQAPASDRPAPSTVSIDGEVGSGRPRGG